jgi:hypothetical protein
MSTQDTAQPVRVLPSRLQIATTASSSQLFAAAERLSTYTSQISGLTDHIISATDGINSVSEQLTVVQSDFAETAKNLTESSAHMLETEKYLDETSDRILKRLESVVIAEPPQPVTVDTSRLETVTEGILAVVNSLSEVNRKVNGSGEKIDSSAEKLLAAVAKLTAVVEQNIATAAATSVCDVVESSSDVVADEQHAAEEVAIPTGDVSPALSASPSNFCSPSGGNRFGLFKEDKNPVEINSEVTHTTVETDSHIIITTVVKIPKIAPKVIRVKIDSVMAGNYLSKLFADKSIVHENAGFSFNHGTSIYKFSEQFSIETADFYISTAILIDLIRNVPKRHVSKVIYLDSSKGPLNKAAESMSSVAGFKFINMSVKGSRILELLK